MANQIPLSTTKAAGGAVVRPETAETLIKGLFRSSGTLAAINAAGGVRRTNSKQLVFPMYLGNPTAGFIAENSAISQTGAEFSDMTVTTKKLGSIVPVTNELLADANTGDDVMSIISNGVSSAIGDAIEQNLLGLSAGANLTSELDFNFRTGVTTNSVNLGTTGDKLRVAVSQAIAAVRSKGYNPTAAVLNVDWEANIRDARGTVETTAPVYSDPNSAFYGLTPFTSTHLNNFSSVSKVVGIVGDFSKVQAVLREDFRLDVTNAGVANGSSAFETDKILYRWITRFGANVAYEDAFCLIKTPAGA